MSNQKGQDEVLQRNKFLEEENLRLRNDALGQGDGRIVEVINVMAGGVILRSPDGKKIYHLDGCNSKGKSKIQVPERYYLHWMDEEILALQLHQIRVEKYILPENEKIPDKFKNFAYTEKEVLNLFKLSKKKFQEKVEEVNEVEIWGRWFNIGEYEYAENRAKNIPNLHQNLEYLADLVSETKRKLHEIDENVEDIITFTGKSRIEGALSSNTFRGR